MLRLIKYTKPRNLLNSYYKCDIETKNRLQMIFYKSDIRKRIQKLPKLPNYKIHKDHTL